MGLRGGGADVGREADGKHRAVHFDPGLLDGAAPLELGGYSGAAPDRRAPAPVCRGPRARVILRHSWPAVGHRARPPCHRPPLPTTL